MDGRYKILSMVDCPFAEDEFMPLWKYADVVYEKPDQKVLVDRISKTDICICSMKTQTNREVIDAGKKLKAVFSPSTGTDHIDID